MELPVYVTVEEVKRVCKALKIRDWTKLTEAKVLPEEARIILSEINAEGMKIDLGDFCAGLEVELEHGVRFKEANVTNNHPILTGKIVLAHFKESLDYYQRLEVFVSARANDRWVALRTRRSASLHPSCGSTGAG